MFIIADEGRSERLADGIVITPSHNPPEDGGFKYKRLMVVRPMPA